MSIQQQRDIEDLKRRVAVLEATLRELLAVAEARKTLTLKKPRANG